MVDVARLGHADHGMDQQIGRGFGRGSHGQFDMGPMHRIPRLEGDDLGPAASDEFGPKLGRSHAKRSEVVVDGRLQAFDPAADVDRIAAVEQVSDARVLGISGAEHVAGFGRRGQGARRPRRGWRQA